MLTDYILIHINGKPFNCSPGISLKDLLTYLNFNLTSIIVEYNYKIINNAYLNSVFIESGDKVEVLTMVGGG